MEEKRQISTNLKENEEYLRHQCQHCDDIIINPMILGDDLHCLAVYVEVTVGSLEMVGQAEMMEISDMDAAMSAMLAGNAVVFMEGYDKAIKISSKGYPGMGVQGAETEKVLRGSKEGFTDAVKTNAALIRKRLRNTKLKVEQRTIGTRSQTVMQLLYVEDLVYPPLLEDIKERLDQYEIDGVFDSGMIEQLTEEVWYSPFPQFQTTERPDKAAMELLDGRIVLLCDNSPVALLLPTTFHNFMQASEDKYNRFEMVSFLRLLRYLAVAIATLLPGLYLAVMRFHTQILPANLVLSFASAREGVPFSGMVELFFLELAFELIREAGVRIPGALGNAVGIVGGLIVGQAAVEANLVSPIVVMIVALTALGSLAIPNEEFSSPFRLLKYCFMFLGGYLGIYGILLGIYGVIGHLAGLLSFHIPYLVPFVGRELDRQQGNGILRMPFRWMKKRPVFARREQRVRLKRR